MDFLNEMRVLSVSMYKNLNINTDKYEPQELEHMSKFNFLESSRYYYSANGFKGAVYTNKENNNLVITFGGTFFLDLGDMCSDLSLMKGEKPVQYNDAYDFYSRVLQNTDLLEGKNIILTGHSLGGALAQLVSALSAEHYPTYAFNSIGVKTSLKKINSIVLPVTSQIHNYSFMNDWFGMMGEHIGNLHILPLVKMDKRDFLYCINATHNTPFFQTVDFGKALSKPTDFTEAEALSLWRFDYMNNKLNPISGIFTSIISIVNRKTSASALENAISILRSNPQFIEHELKYRANGKTYILGLPEKENIIIGSKDNEIIYGGNKTDSMTGGAGKDELHGFEGNDTLRGGSGDDTLYAGDGDDTIYGDAGNDKLFAGMGNNKLYGGSGNDNLHDGPGKNYLSGGTGYDVYITGRYSGGATIGDSDGIGAIQYDGIFLKRATRMPNEEHKWRDDYGNIFKYVSPNLIINNNITVQSFKNCDLGIYLYKEDGTPEPTIPGGNSPGEGEGGEGSGSGSGSGGGDGSVIGSGKGTGESNFDHDDEGNLIDGKNPEEGGGVPSIGEQLGPKPGGGVGDVPPTAGPANVLPVDPLIFDLDFNDIISLSKPEQGRNFDIDNDGIAQKVAWINSGDAILVCDRNGNGTIDNGLELFGDNTLLENGEYAKSGIEALAA